MDEPREKDVPETRCLMIPGKETEETTTKKRICIHEKKGVQRVCASTWKFDLPSLEDQKEIVISLKNEKGFLLKNEKGFSLKKDFSLTSVLRAKMMQQIGCKRSSYKQQDLLKGRFMEEEFITHEDIIVQLIEQDFQCYYCKDPVFVLYDLAREKKQWSVDRIDNRLGHNRGNTRISCLQCNLRKRRTEDERFRFTQQLQLVKVQDPSPPPQP